jgi:anti-sigma regulatory factor (Ser/Thr protein kinase)
MKLDEVDRFILEALPTHPSDIVAVVAKHFDIPKTTVRYRLKRFIKIGHVNQEGIRNKVLYKINGGEKAHVKETTFTYKVGELGEDEIWKKDIKPILTGIPKNILDICSYGFTEMFNNIIDHSKSDTARVDIIFTAAELKIYIKDTGIGAFKNIADHFHIIDIRDAVVKLHQGKVTTDKTKHTGQGIFFTSRAFDKFALMANGFLYIKDNSIKDDWYFERKDSISGTFICLEIELDSKRILKEVFDEYSNPEDLSFDSSHMRIELSVYEEDDYVSRSQAKRLLAGLGHFKTITFDFKNIKSVGQAFVDEVFGVFGLENTQVIFNIINANDDVKFMIKKGLSDRQFPIARILMEH